VGRWNRRSFSQLYVRLLVPVRRMGERSARQVRAGGKGYTTLRHEGKGRGNESIFLGEERGNEKKSAIGKAGAGSLRAAHRRVKLRHPDEHQQKQRHGPRKAPRHSSSRNGLPGLACRNVPPLFCMAPKPDLSRFVTFLLQLPIFFFFTLMHTTLFTDPSFA
jgi:hypothetical protein